MIALANCLIETDDIANHWEAYYVSNGSQLGLRDVLYVG